MQQAKQNKGLMRRILLSKQLLQIKLRDLIEQEELGAFVREERISNYCRRKEIKECANKRVAHKNSKSNIPKEKKHD